jgi:RHS repeat-associated protein
MVMPGRKYPAAGWLYRYGFNGQERSTEINDNSYTAEYWEYDSKIGRRWNIEPLIGKYPNLSSYATLANNPINATDPNGQDVILLTWATKGGDVGHTAIAIQNYKTERIKVRGKWQTVMTPLNSYNVYEIGPASRLFPSQLNTNVVASSPVSRGMTKEQILANRGSDGKHFIKWDANAPDGVVEFKTDAKYDTEAQKKMDDKAESDRLWYKAVGGDGKSADNCTSYVEEVIPRANGETVSGTETVELPNGKKVTSEMPTQLFKSASKLNGANVLKDIPADLKNKSFSDAYYTPSAEKGGKGKKL